MLLAGEPVSFRSPREALERGVAAIAQEPRDRPAADGRRERACSVASRAPAASCAGASLAQRVRRARGATAGFELPGDMSAGRLRTAEQQKVEILRALSRNAELIVMDEPSAALSEHETRQLHEIIRSLARAGTSILLISHFLREVLDLADAVTVLRDGEVVRTAPASAETRVVADRGDARQAADLDVPAQAVPRGRLRPSGSRCASSSLPACRTRRSTCAPARSSAWPGWSGAGRTELARALYGAARVHVGDGVLETGEALGRSPRRSLAAGLVMIPESRKDDGLIFGRSVVENATLSRLGDVSAFGVVRRARERKTARAGARSLRRARRAVLARRCARSRAATSRRCCSPGRCCAAARDDRGRAHARRRRRREARHLRLHHEPRGRRARRHPDLVRARGDPRPRPIACSSCGAAGSSPSSPARP